MMFAIGAFVCYAQGDDVEASTFSGPGTRWALRDLLLCCPICRTPGPAPNAQAPGPLATPCAICNVWRQKLQLGGPLYSTCLRLTHLASLQAITAQQQ
jgi:hypothetical protein